MNLLSIFKAILDKFDVVLLKDNRHVKGWSLGPDEKNQLCI